MYLQAGLGYGFDSTSLDACNSEPDQLGLMSEPQPFTVLISRSVTCLVFIFTFFAATALSKSPDVCATKVSAPVMITETDSHIYKEYFYTELDIVDNESSFYTCDHCEPQCVEEHIAFWCLRGKIRGSSDTHIIIDYNAKATWYFPEAPQESMIVNSTLSNSFCFCDRNDALTNCSSFPKTYGGTFKCVITYSNMMGSSDVTVTETLLFTHSVYTTSDDTKQTQMPTSLFVTSMLSILSSISSSTILLGQTTATPLLTISSSCSSTVTEQQVSTTPYYAGIGLLIVTNLITIILLISSCVYISSQRKKSKL